MDKELLNKTNILKLYLCCLGVTVKQFAEATDINAQALYAYMSGKKPIDKKTARLIEYATGGQITKEELLAKNPKTIEYKPMNPGEKIAQEKSMPHEEKIVDEMQNENKSVEEKSDETL